MKESVSLGTFSFFSIKNRKNETNDLDYIGNSFCFLYACGSKAKSIHSFVGVFTTENGVKFELRADSTTLITFSDSVMYEGTWKFCKTEDHWEYANIEFGGYQEYYYLNNGKLYYSEREMRHDVLGTKVKFRE